MVVSKNISRGLGQKIFLGDLVRYKRPKMAKLGLTSIDRALQNMLGHKPTMIGHPPTMKGHQPTMIWQQPTMIGHQTTIIGQKPLMMGHIPAMKGHRQRMMEHTNIANIEIPSLSILFLIPNMPL